MTKTNTGRVLIQEGKEKWGGVIGYPTNPKPDIKVHGLGGSSSTQSSEQSGSNGSQVNQNKK